MTQQTKAQMSKIAKARWAAMSPRQKKMLLNKMAKGKKAKAALKLSKLAQPEITNEAEVETHASWLAGGFSKEIYHYARSNQISESALTAKVIAILRHSQSR